MGSTNKLGRTFLGAGLAIGLGLTIAAGNPALAQSWTQLLPSDTPPAVRTSHTAVYDPVSNQMIVFAGAFPHFNDLWSLSDANGIGTPTWLQVAPSGGPPAPRFAHKASYDAPNDRMIIFGGGLGFSSPCEDDIWVLSNASGAGGTPTWTNLINGGPAERFGHSQVYDPGSNKLIVFGGSDCITAPTFGDVWVLSDANGLGGTPAWTLLAPTGSAPGLLVNHTAVYDSVSNRMIVFGGLKPGLSLTNNVWVLTDADGTGGTPNWSLLTPSGSPPVARSSHSAVYDAVTNEMIVFGGSATGGLLNDVWVLSDANGVGSPSWTQLSPSGTLPSARNSHSAVFDPGSNRMIVFGGSDTGGFLNDVWVLSLTVFSCAWGGFEPPFNVELMLKKKTKRAIPVQMALEDDSGTIITDADVAAPPVVNVSFAPTGDGGGGEVTSDLLPLGAANDGIIFRFDSDELKWIYNLGTKPFDAPGTYTVTAVAGDASYTIDSSCTGTFVRLE